MRLDREPFEMIRSGKKTIELRLYDEKRRLIKVNDEIEFTCREGEERPVVVRVAALHIFSDFAELYARLPLLRCGYTRETLAEAGPDDMGRYYSAEEQARYGVVGIEIRRVNADDQLIRASRFVSLVLRHRPEAAGITLDAHGWADVSGLLEGVSRRHPLTMEQLEEIVRDDDKTRYSFNADHTRIRANQGHSVPVDVGLTECEPPELVYHGTGEKYLDSILEKGLLAQNRLYVHLSVDAETAKAVGLRHGTPILFTVRSGEMFRDGYRFFLSENGVWLTKYVPAYYLGM